MGARAHALSKSRGRGWRETFYGFAAIDLLMLPPPPPHISMKTTLMLALLAFALGAVSCRTTAPLDPMTMKPSARCTPGVSQSYK
jgi:hypothetical protein